MNRLDKVQCVSFEIGMGCNLAPAHPECPNGLGSTRYAAVDTTHRLTAPDILALMAEMTQVHGFQGWFNFSFYNEPFLQLPLLLKLAQAAAEIAPHCPRMVITNGTLFPTDLEPLRVFTEIHVTDYGGAYAVDPSVIQELRTLTTVRVNRGKLDGRLSILGPDRSHKGCLYPLNDLTVDHYGNLHLCCFDWKGLASPGNVLRDSLLTCLERWESTLRLITSPQMSPDAPEVCRTCRHSRFQTLGRRHAAARLAAKRWLS